MVFSGFGFFGFSDSDVLVFQGSGSFRLLIQISKTGREAGTFFDEGSLLHDERKIYTTNDFLEGDIRLQGRDRQGYNMFKRLANSSRWPFPTGMVLPWT